MKNLYFSSLLSIVSFLCCSQENVSKIDTSAIYVINNTNEFVKIEEGESIRYSLFYRDLKSLKGGNEIIFENAEAVKKFFNTCEKSLATDKSYITQGYNIYRNKISKKTVRINDKSGGYFLIKKETLDLMSEAFFKTIH